MTGFMSASAGRHRSPGRSSTVLPCRFRSRHPGTRNVFSRSYQPMREFRSSRCSATSARSSTATCSWASSAPISALSSTKRGNVTWQRQAVDRLVPRNGRWAATSACPKPLARLKRGSGSQSHSSMCAHSRQNEKSEAWRCRFRGPPFVMTCAGDCNRGANSSEELVMAKYMLAVHSCDGELREPMSAEEMQRSWQQIGVLEAE